MKGKTISLSILALALLVTGYIYFFLNRSSAEKDKSREIVTIYLNENFPEESFKITNVAHYPGEGTYIVHVISKDGSIEGNIDVRDGRIITEGVEFSFNTEK